MNGRLHLTDVHQNSPASFYENAKFLLNINIYIIYILLRVLNICVIKTAMEMNICVIKTAMEMNILLLKQQLK